MSTRARSGRLVSLNGVRLWVDRAGSGDPLVLIPGLGAGNWLWQGMDRLAQVFTLIMPELRGSARSDKPDESYTIDGFAADVLGVMDEAGIGSAHMLGASMGGFVAQAIAARAPERVRRLVLVATSLGGRAQVGPSGEVLAHTIRPRGRSRRDRFEDGYELGFTPRYRETHRARLDAISDWRLSHPQPEWAYYRQVLAGWSYDGADLARRIVAPTLICAGREDVVIEPANALVMRDHIADARVEFFDGRHLFFLEHPVLFSSVVTSFLCVGADGAGTAQV